ncbi:B3 domain-containing transcription repressor VAL1-like protein isoform X1 [Tanacetum coccineum]
MDILAVCLPIWIKILLVEVSLKSDCTITPLFEKVLSAGDAGRIGQLVLPKACAEVERLPIRIQDVKGKEWTFQFRFWPNNNSLIFSRLNQGEKLVVGCRKAAVAADAQEGKTPAANGVAGGTSGGNGNLSATNKLDKVEAALRNEIGNQGNLNGFLQGFKLDEAMAKSGVNGDNGKSTQTSYEALKEIMNWDVLHQSSLNGTLIMIVPP